MICKYQFEWYELDQSVTVGDELNFYFIKGSSPLQFYSGLLKQGKTEVRKCLIKSIKHLELGSVKEIDTKGLDYKIILTNGEKLEINAEENPGEIYNYHVVPTEWKFDIDVQEIT